MPVGPTGEVLALASSAVFAAALRDVASLGTFGHVIPAGRWRASHRNRLMKCCCAVAGSYAAIFCARCALRVSADSFLDSRPL